MATIEIVGAAEVADILGIGNTNFSHLRKQRAGTEDAFPEPLVVLKCGPIWKKSDAVKYAKTFTTRRRPTAAPAPSEVNGAKANGTAVAVPAKKVAAKAPAKAVAKAPSKKIAPRKLAPKKAPAKKLALAR